VNNNNSYIGSSNCKDDANEVQSELRFFMWRKIFVLNLCQIEWRRKCHNHLDEIKSNQFNFSYMQKQTRTDKQTHTYKQRHTHRYDRQIDWQRDTFTHAYKHRQLDRQTYTYKHRQLDIQTNRQRHADRQIHIIQRLADRQIHIIQRHWHTHTHTDIHAVTDTETQRQTDRN